MAAQYGTDGWINSNDKLASCNHGELFINQKPKQKKKSIGKEDKKVMKKKTLISIIAVALVICVSIGGVLAYLTKTTQEVENTFTVGNINLTLTETDADGDGDADKNDYKMIPGQPITKDPKVTVAANSEASYVFVKVTKSTNAAFDDYMTYAMAEGWTALEGNDGVYYREVAATSADTVFAVIADNTVTVKDTVTKEMMDSLTEATYPTLTFKAAAVQKAGLSLTQAWKQVEAEM